MIIRVMVLVSLLATGVSGIPSAEQMRKATLEYVLKGRQAEGIDKISEDIATQVSTASGGSLRELEELAAAAECVGFLKLSQGCAISPRLAKWILGSDDRLHVLIDILSPEDKSKGVVHVLEQLYAHDPSGCEEFYDLAVALAVVLDTSSRPWMHRQMGKNLLPYDPDPVWRYDYFKKLYTGEQAKIDYTDLSARELVFVVQTPVPLSELEWALSREDGDLEEWGEKYESIAYNHTRLESSRFVWDQGTYRLSAIKQKGGICVDQAYYSVVTAQAFGIPSICFSGSGNNANHAWFSFMEKPGDWQLDIGRFGGGFTTGYAVHPQTNKEMTDHDVEYTCERSLRSEKADRASMNLSIAGVLLDRDPDSALNCARAARKLVKRYLEAWDMERTILIRQKDYDGLMKYYTEQKKTFRKYPYILAESGEIIGTTLRDAGRTKEANEIMKKLAGVVDEEQDDIAFSLELQSVEALVAAGDMKKAKREMEQMLEAPENSGNKSFGLIKYYVEMTSESGQSRQAVRFLEDYIEEMLQSHSFPPAYEARLLKYLLQACENAGNEKKTTDVKQRINSLVQ